MHAQPDPTPIFLLSTAYWQSQTLFAACRLGLFAALSHKELTAAEIAQELGTHPRPTNLLLKACTALGLIEQRGDRYAGTPLSKTFLTQGSPSFMGNAIRHGEDMYHVWTHLTEAIRSGVPMLEQQFYAGADPERTRHMVYGMHNRALATGRALVETVDLGGVASMLDVGGGPGTYAALFALKNPGLTVTVLDRPEIVAVAREIVASLRASEQVRFLPGDYHSTAFPEALDAVLLSGVLHREDEECGRMLIARAAASLRPGGRVIASDVFITENAPNPVFAPLFGLNMALSTPHGGVHEAGAVSGWMRDAGLADLAVQRPSFPTPMLHTIITGIKQ